MVYSVVVDALFYYSVICTRPCFNSFDEVVAAVIGREDVHFITPRVVLIYASFSLIRGMDLLEAQWFSIIFY
jgi:hypothetical protein